MGDTERALLLDAFDSNWIAPLGPHVDAFERELGEIVNVPHVAALSSGTAALHLALEVLGIGRGDRVYVSTLTFAATVNAIRYVGATPVFIDSDAESWNIDPVLVAETLERDAQAGELPKALIAVDLYGQVADFDRLRDACRRFDVPIIEDAAESLGATYRDSPAGSLGDLGVFSFNGNKIITTSGGGALVSRNESWIRRTRFLATQAREPAPHYEHEVVGYNYRLSNLLAAVGRGQLRTLAEKVSKRRANFAAYRKALGTMPGLAFMPEPDYGVSSRWLTCLLVDGGEAGVSRDAILQHLASADIEARPVWKPMHLQPVFSEFEVVSRGIAEDLFRRGLCLPSGSSLTQSDLARVVDRFRSTPGIR